MSGPVSPLGALSCRIRSLATWLQRPRGETRPRSAFRPRPPSHQAWEGSSPEPARPQRRASEVPLNDPRPGPPATGGSPGEALPGVLSHKMTRSDQAAMEAAGSGTQEMPGADLGSGSSDSRGRREPDSSKPRPSVCQQGRRLSKGSFATATRGLQSGASLAVLALTSVACRRAQRRHPPLLRGTRGLSCPHACCQASESASVPARGPASVT